MAKISEVLGRTGDADFYGVSYAIVLDHLCKIVLIVFCWYRAS